MGSSAARARASSERRAGAMRCRGAGSNPVRANAPPRRAEVVLVVDHHQRRGARIDLLAHGQKRAGRHVAPKPSGTWGAARPPRSSLRRSPSRLLSEPNGTFRSAGKTCRFMTPRRCEHAARSELCQGRRPDRGPAQAAPKVWLWTARGKGPQDRCRAEPLQVLLTGPSPSASAHAPRQLTPTRVPATLLVQLLVRLLG